MYLYNSWLVQRFPSVPGQGQPPPRGIEINKLGRNFRVLGLGFGVWVSGVSARRVSCPMAIGGFADEYQVFLECGQHPSHTKYQHSLI